MKYKLTPCYRITLLHFMLPIYSNNKSQIRIVHSQRKKLSDWSEFLRMLENDDYSVWRRAMNFNKKMLLNSHISYYNISNWITINNYFPNISYYSNSNSTRLCIFCILRNINSALCRFFIDDIFDLYLYNIFFSLIILTYQNKSPQHVH